MPPMIRITTLALRAVPREIIGSWPHGWLHARQMTWKVMVPSAMQSLMVGMNQVIMLSLNMVIIASMIGAGGLGFDVLDSALRRLDFGAGLEAGFAIVALAIALDRLSQALAAKSSPLHAQQTNAGVVARHPYSSASIGTGPLTWLLGYADPAMQTYPEAWRLSTGTSGRGGDLDQRQLF
jgi:glycine betaine/proline transport system permease protein